MGKTWAPNVKTVHWGTETDRHDHNDSVGVLHATA